MKALIVVIILSAAICMAGGWSIGVGPAQYVTGKTYGMLVGQDKQEVHISMIDVDGQKFVVAIGSTGVAICPAK